MAQLLITNAETDPSTFTTTLTGEGAVGPVYPIEIIHRSQLLGLFQINTRAIREGDQSIITIRNDDGSLAVGALVEIQNIQRITNQQGQVIFPLPSGLYTITITTVSGETQTKENFEL